MKILITGGKGFIGSYLAEILLSGGHEVATYDNHLNFINNQEYYLSNMELRKKYFKHKPSLEFRADIRDIDSLKKACSNFQPEVIVHLAGLPMARPPANQANEMIPINLQGTLSVLNVFESTPSARRFIYTSSSMSYGHFTMQPQPEDSILNPVNEYGATKAAGEYFVKLSKKEWVIIRPTSVYGFTDCANRVTQLLLDAAMLGKPAWIVKGEALDFSYVSDVAEGFALAIKSSKADHETFNMSRGEAHEVSEFVESIKEYFPDFSCEIRDPNSTQVWRGSMDISKAQKMLGFEPKYSIDDGIREFFMLSQEYQGIKIPNLK
ncbi:MAG: GDP-mannose 4,6-dehydratase [Saprospiraceae bacterium]|nr:GDP-mannose 4,6-dehydratase [Saprospiraceae bacterium]